MNDLKLYKIKIDNKIIYPNQYIAEYVRNKDGIVKFLKLTFTTDFVTFCKIKNKDKWILNGKRFYTSDWNNYKNQEIVDFHLIEY